MKLIHIFDHGKDGDADPDTDEERDACDLFRIAYPDLDLHHLIDTNPHLLLKYKLGEYSEDFEMAGSDDEVDKPPKEIIQETRETQTGTQTASTSTSATDNETTDPKQKYLDKALTTAEIKEWIRLTPNVSHKASNTGLDETKKGLDGMKDIPYSKSDETKNQGILELHSGDTNSFKSAVSIILYILVISPTLFSCAVLGVVKKTPTTPNYC